MNTTYFNRSYLWFLVKFICLFVLFYYGTKFFIGASAPKGSYYIPFIAEYLDYISWMRSLLLHGAGWVAGLFGYETQFEDPFLIRVVEGRGVFVAFSCVGYGVMSFWSAYVLANRWKFPDSLLWLVLGNLIIIIINVFRIGLFLVAINKQTRFPFGIDHHTWFNIVAYIAIFMLIYFFEKKQRLT
jgi:exosortase/archaeosortase family protein